MKNRPADDGSLRTPISETAS